MSKIHIMDEDLSNKIAAGEVVERCMNVVKELVENSIDAKSTEIKIEVEEAGTKLVKVTDNGIGMDSTDAKLCFALHATSKIKTVDDLFNIGTLGFRGEALASIASVSEVTLKTSDGKEGTTVKVVGGKIEKVESSDLRKGTSVSVKNLFFNVPARLKHLKSYYTELANISDYVNKIALTYPNIKFELISDGSVLLNTDGSNNLLKNIKCIYGIDVVKRMIEVSASNDDYSINGYISLPEVHRSNKNGMITLVNGRVVRNAELNRTINDAYHSYKPDNRYPIVILNIDVDPSLIDVNVHPTKMDINFSKFDELKTLVTNMINKAIKNINLIPEIEAKEKIYPKVERYTLDLNIEEPEIKYQEQEELIINTDLISTKEKEEEQALETEKMPKMYPVGEVHGTYIVAENDTGMYLIDQHAAKERINYEIVKERLSNPNNESMDMIVPLTLEFTNNEYIILKENMNLLLDMGFNIEEFGINSIIVKSHPTWLGGPYTDTINECIKNIIDMVIEKEKNFDLSRFRDHVAATTACKMSIKANDKITLDEMTKLLEDLRKCKNPFNCPHGRPTVIFYSTDELEKLFKRSGF